MMFGPKVELFAGAAPPFSPTDEQLGLVDARQADAAFTFTVPPAVTSAVVFRLPMVSVFDVPWLARIVGCDGVGAPVSET